MHDPSLCVELLMSTHLTVVVRVRAEFDDDTPPLDVPLVIARRCCDHDCPARSALLEAGREWLGQRQAVGGAAARRLLARVDDRWQVLIDVDARVTMA